MTWSSSRHVVTTSLTPSRSHHSQCVGGARDTMRGLPDGGVRDPGSLTLPLRRGSVRPSPRIFLTRSPTPPARHALEEGPAALSSAPRTNRGSSRPPVPLRSKGKAWLPPAPRRGTKGPHHLVSLHLRMEGRQRHLPSSLSGSSATYASSVSTSLSAYVDLPGHHLRSTLDLITSPPVSSYPEDPTSGDDEWAGTDFSGCGDPETFMRFLEASNYCLGYSDSDDGSYDPSRECFNLEVGGAPHNV